MRQERPQPKICEQVSIPADLLEFLQEVNRLIEAHDEFATTESDDLLQCKRAYGGLIREGGDRYAFTYFPEPGIRHKWEFEFAASKIANVADGVITELELWGCRDPECRCMFQDPDDTCFYCDYVDE